VRGERCLEKKYKINGNNRNNAANEHGTFLTLNLLKSKLFSLIQQQNDSFSNLKTANNKLAQLRISPFRNKMSFSWKDKKGGKGK